MLNKTLARSFTRVALSRAPRRVVTPTRVVRVQPLFQSNILSRFNATGNVELSKNPVSRQQENPEYHVGSTRWSNTTPEVLKAFDVPIVNPHQEPSGISDHLAWNTIKVVRALLQWYFQDRFVLRAILLETVAAVPPMVSGMTHHLRSLRKLQHDNWIKTLMDEAENERMHLMTWMELAQPTPFQRLLILAVQGIFWNAYFVAYLLAPKFCHRFVGYLEEEAVNTYTKFLKAIDSGKIPNGPAPKIGIEYWGLPANATIRDLVLVIRADEMDHRDVNHTLSDVLKDRKSANEEYSPVNVVHKPWTKTN